MIVVVAVAVAGVVAVTVAITSHKKELEEAEDKIVYI